MSVETTILIKKEVLDEVNRASVKTGMSRSEVISVLLERIMNDYKDMTKLGKRVKYQPREDVKDRHCFHVCFKENDYEYFLDLRKLFKLSLSYLLAISVKRYLRSIINEECTDNYRFSNYVLTAEIINGVISWRLLWGYPEIVAKLLLYN